MTPLHWAVKRNNTEMISLLLKYNADINAKDIVIYIYISYK